jgi:uncharacterized protein (TIGR02118 family)
MHLLMSEQLLSEFGFQGYEVQRCTAAISGDKPEFLCITQLEFHSLDELRRGMQVHGEELSEGFSRYTDIQPVATVTEIMGKK